MKKLEKICRSGNLKDFKLFFKNNIKNYCSDNGVEIVRNLIHYDNEDNKFKLFKCFIDYLSDKKFIKISDDFLFKISSILIDNNYMDFFKYAISKKFYISSDNCAEIIRKLIHSDNEYNKFELFKYFIDRLKNRSYLIIKIFKEVYKKQDADFIEYLEKKFHIKEILLIEACGKNNLEWVKYLVRNGANINVKINNHNIFEYFDYCTILDLDIKIIEYLLNYANEENYKSALFICCENNYFELAKYILSKGIDINIKNRYGETPLIMACLNEHLNLAEYLIKNGDDINIKDNDGHDALYYAELYKRQMTIELLVKYKV